MPRRVVVEMQTERAVVGTACEPVDLLDCVGERAGHLYETSGSDFTIDPASRRASIASAIATIA
jgi:hypothetical protein